MAVKSFHFLSPALSLISPDPIITRNASHLMRYVTGRDTGKVGENRVVFEVRGTRNKESQVDSKRRLSHPNPYQTPPLLATLL
mmetsp:Transcript_16633/g.34335  ORF Transcript_16633/g.34335 Transcript_16633/m.34335 type:complete len:83 (-) Transcript_16633:193-441(-)